MSDPMNSDPLKALEKRIGDVKASQGKEKRMDEHYSAANVGWRMVTELVAGLGIGFGIGFGLDHLFGTLPWLMLIFTMLGFVAGVKTMLRSAHEFQNVTPTQSRVDNDKRT
jgi:ATP synthase protein I